jgi:hypothetical protein
MDTLLLKKFQRKEVSFHAKKWSGNLSINAKGHAVKSEREYLDFMISGVPLAEKLDDFYGYKGGASITDSDISMLGSHQNVPLEIIKVKQLLLKPISDEEIGRAFAYFGTEIDHKELLREYRRELEGPEVLIYGCAECGDIACGGVMAKIEKTDNAFIWTITEGEKQLVIEFDRYQYYQVFGNYLKTLEVKLAQEQN